MKITEDGYYKINGKQGIGGGTSIVYLSGAAGSAIMTLGYFDDYGTFIPLADGVILSGSQTQVDHGAGDLPIYLEVAGSNVSTVLSMFVNGKS